MIVLINQMMERDRMSEELEIESAQRRLREAECIRDNAIKQLILADKEVDKWKKIIEELTEVKGK